MKLRRWVGGEMGWGAGCRVEWHGLGGVLRGAGSWVGRWTGMGWKSGWGLVLLPAVVHSMPAPGSVDPGSVDVIDQG